MPNELIGNKVLLSKRQRNPLTIKTQLESANRTVLEPFEVACLIVRAKCGKMVFWWNREL